MKKLFSLLTLALLTLSVGAANTYVKVTSTNQLEVGQKYIIVNEDAAAGMGAITGGSTKYAAAIAGLQIAEGVVDIENIAVVELTLGGEANAWTFDMGEGAYMFWSSGNSLNTTNDATANGAKWTAVAKDGGYILTNNAGTNDNRTLQYNATSGQERFATYKGTQQDAVLYVKDASVTPPVTVAAPTLPEACTFEDSYTVVITNNEDGATLYYSTDGLAWTEGNSVTITETTKVYAKASKDGVDSPVVSATYTKVEPTPEGVVVFVPATDKGNGSTTRGEWTVVKDGVTMTCSDGTVYDENYRIYQGATLTFTAGDNITKIEFTGGDTGRPISNLSTETGTLTTEGSNGTWVGEATEIVFTASAQARASEIRVYVGGEAPVVIAAPTLPEAQNFTDSFTVTITNNEDGATLYYSYDNTTWTEYTEALVLTETKTVYAKAVKGENESVVVSATYTKVEPVTGYEELNDVNEQGYDVEFTFVGDAVVTFQKGGYLWIRDNSGYGLIYGNTNGTENPTFDPGTVLAKGWSAKTKDYNGLMEYVNATGLADSGNDNAELAAIQTITALDANMLNAYVQVLNVKSFAVSGKNVIATLADGTTMAMYKTFNDVDVPSTEGNYTVIGAVSTYNGNLQLTIIDIQGVFVADPVITPASCDFEESVEVTITAEEGAAIKYSYNNETWNDYSEPLTITETTTVYAKAVKDNVESGVVSATYTKVDPATQVTYTLVTDVNELADGDKIILVGFCADTTSADYGKPYAMAGYRGDSYGNFASVEVNVVDNTVTTALANVITLEANGEYWNLKAAEGYLWAAGNSTTNKKNQMKVEDEVDADGNANAAITIDGAPVIAFQGTNDRNYLRYNYNSGNCLFSCYAQGSSVQTPAYIFKAKSEPAGLRGDVNQDQVVNIDDVTALIDILLMGTEAPATADCDLSGGVSIDDVTSLIDYLLMGHWPGE